MEISLRNLPDDGLKVNGEISLDNINARMNESSSNTVQFLSEPLAELVVYPVLGGAEIYGSISAKYSQPCSRCSELLNADLSAPIKVSLKQKTGDHVADEDDAQPGILYVDGDNIDFEDYLQESLILALPFTGPEHQNCSWNKEIKAPIKPTSSQSLGDLLKKAGVK